MQQETGIMELKGIGPKYAALLAGRGIETIRDLLSFYPLSYIYYEKEVPVAQARAGMPCSLRLLVTGGGSIQRMRTGTIVHFEGADLSGRVRLTFFNMPYVRQTLQAGGRYVFMGILRETKTGARYMEQPWFTKAGSYDALRGTLQPQYPKINGIGQARMQSFIKAALENTEGAPEDLPAGYLRRYELVSRMDALRGIHFPGNTNALADARKRLVFDEFLDFILSVRRQKSGETARRNPRPMLPRKGWCEQFLGALPFSLTKEQTQAFAQIRADLAGEFLMNRLLQGDVGSGKTVLAFLALLLCAENERQGALMAPTEVLARQHMEGLLKWIERAGLPVRPVLLTGSVKGKARKEALAAIRDGTADIVIGTHALFQEKVRFRDLGLVVTDEQHRFGVRQRTSLAGKGEDVPVLVMSATPIPRTLAIILYGDLQVSSLKTLPPGRLPVKSLALQDTMRGSAYRFILSQIEKGRQCYVICPAVDQTQTPELENVMFYTEKLRATLPEKIRILSLTGRMPPAKKNEVMEAFLRGDADILVSTTVIEVGIDVPNASVILIENAQRFGLSQLHQLRGRVGRGQNQSYCIFLYTGAQKPPRLSILEKYASGFSIAQQDLKTRGPGDLFGTRQSGLPQFTLADIYEDAAILRDASACADELLRDCPGLFIRQEKAVDLSTI